MINKLNELDLDIKRCEIVLKENNYLDIVIAIEEIHDKYKNTIDSISNISRDVVWNYSKKDIENIQNYLKDDKFIDLKEYIEDKDILEKQKLVEAINLIENINNDDLNLDEKWDKLKLYLELIKNQGREIGTQLLEIIVLMAK